MILLDSNICIAILHSVPAVVNRLSKVEDVVAIPGMVEGELFYGVEKSLRKDDNLRACEEFLQNTPVVYPDHAIMFKFGELKARLERQGNRVDDADIMIAATAICNKSILATGNVRHFERFDELEIQNWFATDQPEV